MRHRLRVGGRPPCSRHPCVGVWVSWCVSVYAQMPARVHSTRPHGTSTNHPYLALPSARLCARCAVQNRDRFIMKSGGAIAVLKEFWEEQDREFAPVYSGNTLSRL